MQRRHASTILHDVMCLKTYCELPDSNRIPDEERVILHIKLKEKVELSLHAM